MKSPILSTLNIRSLLWAIESKQTVSVKLDDCRSEANGLLLGADLNQEEILLSETHPDISHHFTQGVSPRRFWARIKISNRYLCLSLLLSEIHNGLITAKILDLYWSQNKRWQNRVAFHHLRGPRARLNREYAANIQAHINNLSAEGAALDIWGHELNREICHGDQLVCHIHFNPQFEMQVNAKVLSSQFKRSPSCHTHIRLKFENLSSIEYSQLIQFVDSCASHPYSLSNAA